MYPTVFRDTHLGIPLLIQYLLTLPQCVFQRIEPLHMMYTEFVRGLRRVNSSFAQDTDQLEQECTAPFFLLCPVPCLHHFYGFPPGFIYRKARLHRQFNCGRTHFLLNYTR